jgi:hypothetical protein
MSAYENPQTVQTLDDALRAAEVGGGTRRWLLERAAAIGAAGVAAGAAFSPATGAAAGDGGNSVPAFGKVAVTTEALTVVLLTELQRRVRLHPEVPAGAVAVIEGASPPKSITCASRANTGDPPRRRSGSPTGSLAARATPST